MLHVGHGTSATTIKPWTEIHAKDLKTNMGNGFEILFTFENPVEDVRFLELSVRKP